MRLDLRNSISNAAISLLVAAIALAGCALRLTPDYDKDIYDGLSAANDLTMTLFASITAGSSYSSREDAYAAVIGKLGAVELEAEARPNPKIPGFANKIAKKLAMSFDTAAANLTSDQLGDLTNAPTPELLRDMVVSVTLMRSSDQQNKLKPSLVVLFESEFEIYMFIALNYEKSLGAQK